MIMTQSKNNNLQTIGGISLLIIFYLLAIYSGYLGKLFLHTKDKNIWTTWSLILSQTATWSTLGIVALYARKVEKQPFLLWKDKKYVWWQIILFALIIILVSALVPTIVNSIISHLGHSAKTANSTLINNALEQNILLLISTCITAGIAEELLFRGYLLSRLNYLLNRPTLSIIIAALIFSSFHLGWGSLQELVSSFWIGLVFGFFYWKYRNLKLLITIHFLWDLIQMIM